MNITIRLAVPNDALDMAEVLMRSWEIAYKNILPAKYICERNATRPEQYRQAITDENENSYVIQKDSKTIGIMRIGSPQDDDLDDSFYELHYIYLHPDCFRQGIGTEAMKFVFDKTLELDKKTIVVWVLAGNINSIKFYEKCGFRADNKTAIQDRGKPVKIIRMRKDLTCRK